MSERSVLGEARAAAFPGIDEALLPPVHLPPYTPQLVVLCEECGQRPYDLLHRERLLCTRCIVGAVGENR